MAMNNFMIDPVTGQPLQKAQPQLDPMTGMPIMPAASTPMQMANQAVYGKQQPMQVGEQIFGNEAQRQATVAMINQ